jgi:hypothetical protein
MTTTLWYLAHPIAPDEKFSFEENMAHALQVARILTDAGLSVCLPWFAMCRFLDDSNPEHRALGMEFNKKMVKRLDGLLLTGHKISKGMQIERETCNSCVDLTGTPDKRLAEMVRKLHLTDY